MTAWNYIVICLSLVLLVLLLLAESRRENRARLGWRMAITVLLVAALAALALPIGYRLGIMTGSKEGILLTEGYDPDSVRLYVQTTKAPVWVSAADVKEQGLSALHLFGYGLTKEQCAALPRVPLVFHRSSMPAGIGSIYWRRSLWPGEVCRIQGHFYNPRGGAVKLLLTGMYTILDSTAIKFGEGGDFELRTVPVQAGRAIYHLIALRGADTLEQEAIPVEVLPGKDLKILLLAAAPDFENRFLVNWLSDKGHGVAVRTAISKGKYVHADLNVSAGPVDHLSSALLDKFDVVIADAAELKAMGTAQYALLRRQVAEKGLGLIVKADSASVITDKPGERSMIRDSLHRTLVSANMYGAGKIIHTTLQTTYARLLAGNKKEYAALWTSILQQAAGENGGAGKDAAMERWQLTPALPVVDQPVRALLQSAGSGLPQGLFEEADDGGGATPVVAYLAQHSLLPFAWEGLYWPRVAGWHTVRTSQGDRTWWYAWSPNDWLALHRMERMGETERWMAGIENGKVEQTAVKEETQRVLVGKGWFYLVILLCCLFLWVERKI